MSCARSIQFRRGFSTPAATLLLLVHAAVPGLALGASETPGRFATLLRPVSTTPLRAVRPNIVDAPALLLGRPLGRAYRDNLRVRIRNGRLLHGNSRTPLNAFDGLLVQMGDGRLYCSVVLNDTLASMSQVRPIRMAVSIDASAGKISRLRLDSPGYEIGERHVRAFVYSLAARDVCADQWLRDWREVEAMPKPTELKGFRWTMAMAGTLNGITNWVARMHGPRRLPPKRPNGELLEIDAAHVIKNGALDWTTLDEMMVGAFGRLLPRPLRGQGLWLARRSPNSLVLFHAGRGYRKAFLQHKLHAAARGRGSRPKTVTNEVMATPRAPLFGFIDRNDVLHLDMERFAEPSQCLTAMLPLYAHRLARKHLSPTLQLAMAEHLAPPGVPPLSRKLRLAMNHLASYLGESTIEQALFKGEVKAFDWALQCHLGTPDALAHLEYALGALQRLSSRMADAPGVAVPHVEPSVANTMH